jgi:hypothetical protein
MQTPTVVKLRFVFSPRGNGEWRAVKKEHKITRIYVLAPTSEHAPNDENEVWECHIFELHKSEKNENGHVFTYSVKLDRLMKKIVPRKKLTAADHIPKGKRERYAA